MFILINDYIMSINFLICLYILLEIIFYKYLCSAAVKSISILTKWQIFDGRFRVNGTFGFPALITSRRMSLRSLDCRCYWLTSAQNGHHFVDDIFNNILWIENNFILIEILFKFVPDGPIDKKLALVQVMAWCRTGTKPLSEPMMAYISDAHRCHVALIY